MPSTANLVNMKQAPTSEKPTTAVTPERPAYPWGLSLTLEEDALEKLGLTDLPKVGAARRLVARVEVTSVSAREAQGEDGPHRSVGLQITDMALGPEETTDRPATEDVLYRS